MKRIALVCLLLTACAPSSLAPPGYVNPADLIRPVRPPTVFAAQGRFTVEALAQSEKQATEIDVSFKIRPTQIVAGARLDVDFEVHNKSKVDRCAMEFTYYFPANARYETGTLALVGNEGGNSTIEVLADRFIVRNQSLAPGHKVKGGFGLRVSDGVMNGEIIKNVFTYTDCLMSAPIARKTEETVGAKPKNLVVPATLPALEITNQVGLVDGGGEEAEVGDELGHAIEVVNRGDVPVDETVADLPLPEVAELVPDTLQVDPDYEDLNDPAPGASDTLTIEMGSLRGGERCNYRSRIVRGAADQTVVRGAVKVRSQAWGIAAEVPMVSTAAGPIVVVAPVLDGEVSIAPTFLPVAPGSGGTTGGIAPMESFRLQLHVRNIGHGRATGVRMIPKMPGPGFRVRRASPGVGSNRIILLPGQEAWIYCEHEVPPDWAGQPFSIDLSWESDQTLPHSPPGGWLAAGVSIHDGPEELVEVPLN